MMKMKHKDINKLRSLTLTLSSVSFSLKGMKGIQDVPIYRVEISLGNESIM